jgi:predicted Zn-dependent protease with MMP-like domain
MRSDWPTLAAIAEAEVESLLNDLPSGLRAKARAVAVTFESQPDKSLQADGIEEDTLGLFIGGDVADAESGSGDPPPQIILFLANIFDLAEGNEAEYRKEIRKTFLHELGHYLGLDELDLEARGLD